MAVKALELAGEHDAIKYGLIIGGALLAGWYLYNKFVAPDPASYGDPGASSLLGDSIAPGGENADYEGYGLLGTLGAFFNTLSGGSLDALGNYLGGAAYDEYGD